MKKSKDASEVLLFAYARVSSQQQRENNSISQQQFKVMQFVESARSDGWKITHWATIPREFFGP